MYIPSESRQSPTSNSDSPSAPDKSNARICRETLDDMARATIITDAAGGIRYLNAEAERLLGYRQSEVFGWALPALITSCEALWRDADAGLRRLLNAGAGEAATLYLRTGGSIRVLINGIRLPAPLGGGFTLKEITDTSRRTTTSCTARQEERAMTDTRSGKRTPAQALVQIQGSDGTEVSGVIRDISRSGLFIETPQPDQIQSCIILCLMSDDRPPQCLYQTAAVVAHRQQHGIGVMFPDGSGHIISSLCQQMGQSL